MCRNNLHLGISVGFSVFWIVDKQLVVEGGTRFAAVIDEEFYSSCLSTASVK